MNAACIETDDDVYMIHYKVCQQIKVLKKETPSKQKLKKDKILYLLSFTPPHGFTKEDWEQIQEENFIEDHELRPASKSTITYKECKDLIAEIEQLNEYDNMLFNIDQYESEASNVLDTYKHFSTNVVVQADFMNIIKRKEDSPQQTALKRSLLTSIEQYFGADMLDKVVTKKVSYAGTFNLDLNDAVGGGNGSNDSLDQPVDTEEEWNSMVYNDINRINFNIKFKYDKRQHFKDTINQYQGLQQKHIPSEVYADIIKMIESHGLANMNEKDPKLRYAKLRKQHITMFLNETGHCNYYEDKQLIYSKITTHECPNIQVYEKGLFSDFEQLVEVFLSLSENKVDRKNFLNTHYVLRQLLRKRGVIVPEEDLNNLKTPGRIRAHDEIYQMCCDKLGWNFQPLG